MDKDLLCQDDLQTMFEKFKAGESRYFYMLVDYFLDLLVEELVNFEEEFEPIGLIALFCAIKSYNPQSDKDSISHVRRYIHLNLLINRENRTRLDPYTIEIYFPAYNVMIFNALFLKYLRDIRQKKEQYILKTTGKTLQKCYNFPIDTD